jgi:hypothetical protein
MYTIDNPVYMNSRMTRKNPRRASRQGGGSVAKGEILRHGL